MKEYILFLVVAGLSLYSLLSPVGAMSDPTNYPYKNSPKGQVDKWAFYTRYCTSYSAYRGSLIVANFHNTMKGPNGKFGNFGNANNWDNNARNIGYTVTTTPTAGAIAVWEARAGNSGSVGHVAYVEKVNSNNTFNISEYNWNYGDGNYNIRNNLSVISGLSFIVLGNPNNTCLPPTQGDWVIDGGKNCELSSNTTLTGNLTITDNSSLTLKGNTQLNINLKDNKIEVKNNSNLYIKDSARIN